MALSEKQFNILCALVDNKSSVSQRQISDETSLSLATVNRTLKELSSLGLVNDGIITDAGINALEPYRIKRAVFLAAGFGSRMVPITLSTPKPLVRIHGVRIIDRLIDACLAIGINEIYIVRGYLSENFDCLVHKYPMIHFLENDIYNETNNISSALCARQFLSNCYVFEGDLLLSNQTILKKYHYQSEFLAIKKDRTDDWCFEAIHGRISGLRHGGLDCWQEVGISYWCDDDGKNLCNHLKEAFDMPGGKELFFEAVPLTVFRNSFSVKIDECNEDDIIEIDSFNELKAIDKSYDI